jgi:ABC-type Fe3+-hydroxamate transport system substrate-binding protein
VIVQRVVFSLAATWLGLVLVSCGEPGSPTNEAPPAGGTVASAPIRVTDDAGRAVLLPRPATRVISLVPSITETIVALGAADRLVARTDYDEDPAIAHLPSLGGGLTPSLELIASLRADLVIAWEEAGAARIRPQLETLGIPVYADQTRDTAGVYSTIERLGQLLGVDGAADSLARAMRMDLSEVAGSVAGRSRPSVLYLVSLDPPMAAGPTLFIGEMLDVAGGANAFADLTAPSPQISMEEIVRRRPEVILIPTGAAGADLLRRLSDDPGWSELIQSRETRIETLPADILHRPGPAIVDGARALRDAIHPAATGAQ